MPFGERQFGAGPFGEDDLSDSGVGVESLRWGDRSLRLTDIGIGVEVTHWGDWSPRVADSGVGVDTQRWAGDLLVSDTAEGVEELSFIKRMSIAEARGRTRLAPICLVEIILQGSGAPTLYLSDRNITVAGQIYEYYITGVDGLAEEIKRATSEGLNPRIDLTFWNARYAAYNYLIEIGDTYPFEGAILTVKECYLNDDGVPSVVETLFKGALDEPRDIDLMKFTCSASSMLFAKDQQWKQSIIAKAVFPNADPDDLNKHQNIIYGSCQQVRCHAIKAGAVDFLSEDITASSPATFHVSDASEFPSAGAFTVQIENEQIRISSRSGNILTVQTRGYNSTTALTHDKGMAVFEILTEYVYMVAGHPVKTIGDVYVDGVRQLTGVTKYTGQSGSEHGSYPGKAVLAFSAKALVKKQVDLTNNDSIGVNDPQHQHAASVLTDTVVMNQYTINSGSWTFTPSNIIDNNFNNSAVQDPSSNTDVNRILPYNNGIPSRIRVGINHSDAVYNNIAAVNFYLNGSLKQTMNFNGSPSKTTTYSNWYTLSSWGHVNAANTYVNIITTAGNSFRVWEIWYEVEYDPTTSTVGTNVSKTGTVTLTGNSAADVVVGGSVNCDVDGYRDDGSGTYTGSALALIERPDHVFKHFIDVLYGFALSDIDTTSFSAAGALYAAAISGGYKLAFVINDEIKPSRLLSELAFQCRSNLKYDRGLWYLQYLPDVAPSVVRTIAKKELSGQYTKFTFNKTDSVDIANDLTAKFKRNYGGIKYDEAEWLGTSTASDATSQGKYGVRAKMYDFPAIRLQAMADHVLAWIKLQNKNPLLIVEFPVFWEHFDLVRGNTFDIDNPLYGGKKFYIEKVERVDKGIVRITGVEWPA